MKTLKSTPRVWIVSNQNDVILSVVMNKGDFPDHNGFLSV